MKRWTVPALAALALTLGGTRPLDAQEPHFTFRVPVELYDLHPEVVAVRIDCVLMTASSNYPEGPAPPGGWVARSPEEVPEEGRVSGELVATAYFEGVSQEALRSLALWDCQLKLKGVDTPWVTPPADWETQTPMTTSREGTERVYRLNGELPPQGG